MRRFFDELKDFPKKGDTFLLVLCLIVSGFGLICIASATSADKFGSNIRYITLQSVAIMMGVAAYIFISSLDLDLLSEHRFLLVARKKHQYYYGIAPSAALHRLWADNIARHPGDPHWERWRKQYLYYNTHDMARTYVVLCGDDPVGEGTLLFSPSCSAIRERTVLADDHTVANVNALRILKEHEGQGHISAIVHQMMADARRRGFTRLTIGVEADNARNRAIYRHWGFTDLVLKAKEDGKEILYFAKEI